MGLRDFLDNFASTEKNYYAIDSLNKFTCRFIQDEETLDKALFLNDDEDGKKLLFENFQFYAQNVIIPNFTSPADKNIESAMGTFVTQKLFLTPDSQTFTLEIINTKKPILENVFLPWMREVQSPQWVYPTHPYTKGTFELDMTSHNNIKYRFLGCRPTSIASINPSHELPSSLTRQLTLTFDFMYAIKEKAEDQENEDIKNLSRYV